MSTTSSESYDQSIPQQPDPGGQQLLSWPGGRNILDSPEPQERPQIPPETLYSNQSYYFHHVYMGGGSSSSAAQLESKDLGNRQQIDKFEEGHAPQGLFQAIPHSSHGQFEVVGGFITNQIYQHNPRLIIPVDENPPAHPPSFANGKGAGKTQWHLISHNNSHTNIKPFACTLCPLSFARKHDLSRHERSVHAVKAGAPVFACGICGKGFGRVDSLKRHVKICKG
ncbi:hypothetical protein BCR33DRAFT_711105 [Rhizoclosmatium globosum]|uniref:C2H2-type domain-containing protein n=1 Tax=Rhizoclosmatium globosum TaxID=329046 RepID=A0A1Y2D3M5_9FUNG|nr:hypothetical protein BCR33DRAFT_711105 [Rhizoclosmatium globosum]|eukprot:ORY53744.1 hypothetical protein BCR33DRAFT_711105 [Rhizoclosmatium globosum]